MRTLSSAALTALASRNPPLAVMVEMDLTVPLYLNSTAWDLSWNGHTWLGTGGLGTVQATQESVGDARPLQFGLSGVPSSEISLALTENIQGAVVKCYLAVFDTSTYQILDCALEWSGRLDTMEIVEDDKGTATITVTAEHAAIDLMRAAPSLYTDIEQQRLYPGDIGLQYVTDTAMQQIVWPAAAYFRQ